MSIKLSDVLKATIEQAAALDGKSAHVLMVDSLQSVMDAAPMQQTFFVDANVAYQDTLQSNLVYSAEDAKAFVRQRAQGGKPVRPNAAPFNANRVTRET